METEAAVLWERHGDWSVEPIELDPPKDGEVLVRLAASGMCHSDEHLVTGDMPVPLPVIGGHEGAGVVEEVGPGVTALAPGDHVVFGFVPACGKCPSCATGHSNLCDVGAVLMAGRQMDGTIRHHARGKDVSTMVCLGTFAQVHRGEPGLLREDPRRHPAGQGVPRRLRRHHRLGLGGVRGGRPAGRQRRGDRHRRHRCVRAPGRAVGRSRNDLRHRPCRAQAHAGAHVRGHPHGSPRSRRPSSWCSARRGAACATR